MFSAFCESFPYSGVQPKQLSAPLHLEPGGMYGQLLPVVLRWVLLGAIPTMADYAGRTKAEGIENPEEKNAFE